jgi:hypothetical protein
MLNKPKQNNLVNYIKESSQRATNRMREKSFIGDIVVYIKDELNDGVSLDLALSKLKKYIPRHLFSGIDVIYVGQFDKLKKKAFNAAFMDGAIYVSNVQTSTDDMLDDFIHELAHSIEEMTNFEFYSDDKMNNEFLAKRLKLKEILQTNGYDVSKHDFSNIEYNEDFDMYLYEEIGYPALTTLTVGLFCSPYGATSIREYFANAFEHYFMKDPRYVKKISPQVHKTINALSNPEYFDNLGVDY